MVSDERQAVVGQVRAHKRRQADFEQAIASWRKWLADDDAADEDDSALDLVAQALAAIEITTSEMIARAVEAVRKELGAELTTLRDQLIAQERRSIEQQRKLVEAQRRHDMIVRSLARQLADLRPVLNALRGLHNGRTAPRATRENANAIQR